MNIKLVGDVYGVILKLKDNYDTIANPKISFDKYIELEMKGLMNSATEWLADDEREAKQSI